jgi:hypothetical protein
MLIHRCPIWLRGALIVALALGTSGIMATRGYLPGDATSILAALLAAPGNDDGAIAAKGPAAPPAAVTRASVAQAGPAAALLAAPGSGAH